MINVHVYQSNDLWQKAKQFNVLIYVFLNTDSNCIYTNQVVSLGASLLAVTTRFVEADSQSGAEMEVIHAKHIITEIESCIIIAHELNKINKLVLGILINRLLAIKERFELLSNNIGDTAEII
jgi:hypothetical protein